MPNGASVHLSWLLTHMQQSCLHRYIVDKCHQFNPTELRITQWSAIKSCVLTGLLKMRLVLRWQITSAVNFKYFIQGLLNCMLPASNLIGLAIRLLNGILGLANLFLTSFLRLKVFWRLAIAAYLTWNWMRLIVLHKLKWHIPQHLHSKILCHQCLYSQGMIWKDCWFSMLSCSKNFTR